MKWTRDFHRPTLTPTTDSAATEMIKTFISYDILVVVHGYLLLFIVYSISFWRGREAKLSISVPILGARHWTQFIGDIYQCGQKYIGCLIKLKDVKLNDMLYVQLTLVCSRDKSSLPHTWRWCMFCSWNDNIIVLLT